MQRLPLAKGVIAFLIAYPLLTIIGLSYGEAYGRACFPLYRLTLDVVAPDFTVARLKVNRPRHEKLIVARFVSQAEIPSEGRSLPAGAEIKASTLLGHAVQHLILMYTVIVAWLTMQSASLRRWIVTFGVSVPVLAAVEALDVPFVLAGSVADLVLFELAPGQLATSPLVNWMNFLNGGGRLALALVGGAVAVWIATMVAKSRG